MRTAAIIDGDQVANVIVLADGEDGNAALAYYEAAGVICVEITDMDPQPGIGTGWTYANGQWTAPPRPNRPAPTD